MGQLLLILDIEAMVAVGVFGEPIIFALDLSGAC
jgi:hypothetical protein